MARWMIGALTALLLSGGSAWSHGARAPEDTSGILIAFITHGEMAVLAAHRSEIIALADRVRQPDTELWSLVRYAVIQHADCLWGLVPGSLTDEESPFNECSHADLAATKAILFRLRDLPAATSEATGLISRIDAEMVREGAAFIGCQYSGEGFNTATIVRPHWIAVPGHLSSLLSLLMAFAGLPAVTFGLSRLGRVMPRRGGQAV